LRGVLREHRAADDHPGQEAREADRARRGVRHAQSLRERRREGDVPKGTAGGGAFRDLWAGARGGHTPRRIRKGPTMPGLVSLFLLATPLVAPASAPDRPSIEAAVAHYFVAGDTNSSAELKQAFHPAAMMFFVRDGGLVGVSQTEWWSRIEASKETVKALSRAFPLVDQAG